MMEDTKGPSLRRQLTSTTRGRLPCFITGWTGKPVDQSGLTTADQLVQSYLNSFKNLLFFMENRNEELSNKIKKQLHFNYGPTTTASGGF